jgi:hypothetical protein
MQQINQAYALLLAAQFQGFCRDLHQECVDHVLGVINPPRPLYMVLLTELTRVRQLDRGNAHSGSLAADFGRLGIDLWTALASHSTKSMHWRQELDRLNAWRNVIAHQSFGPGKLGGATRVRLSQVRNWRKVCHRLGRAIVTLLHAHLQTLTGSPPWQ